MKIFKIFVGLAMFMLLSQTQMSYAQGCMDEGEDDGDGVKVFGFFQPQADFQIFDKDGILGDNGKNQSNFYFNRARLGVMGQIPYDFSYYFVTEMAPKQNIDNAYAATICDAFITYKRFAPYVKVSVGQFKAPFGAEQLHGCHKLLTINRSEVVNNLAGPIRDMGIMVSGSIDTLFGENFKDLIGYTVAVLNGTGRNIFDNNLKKDVVGRLTLKPVDFFTLGASYRFGAHPALVPTSTTDDTRSRLGMDATINWNNLFIQGEYIQGANVGSYTTGGGCGGPLEVHEGSVDQRGFFVQGAYMTPWYFQPVVKYETYDPNIAEDSTGDIQNIVTFGLNYFFNDWTRVQLNYLYKAEENGNVETNNDEILLQFQLVF